jgi:hypothetical protein
MPRAQRRWSGPRDIVNAATSIKVGDTGGTDEFIARQAWL